jgi:alkylhydroperoxidase/carboxymuconolactone decarboxylase family protein YurZ
VTGTLSGEGWLRDAAPEYDAVRGRLLALVFSPTRGTLPLKYRAMIAGLVAATRSTPTVEAHFRAALTAGATVAEIVEAVEVAELPGGPPALDGSIDALRRIGRP